MHKKQHPFLGAVGVLGAGTSVLAEVGGSPPVDDVATSTGAEASSEGPDGVPISAVT